MNIINKMVTILFMILTKPFLIINAFSYWLDYNEERQFLPIIKEKALEQPLKSFTDRKMLNKSK